MTTFLVLAAAMSVGCGNDEGDGGGPLCTPEMQDDSSPPTGKVGNPYFYDLIVTCGCNDVAWEITRGQLPEGLDIVDNAIQGTPALSGIFNSTLRYDSHCQSVADASFPLSIVISPPPACAPLALVTQLPDALIDTEYTAPLFQEGANGPLQGEGQWQIRVSSGELPPGMGSGLELGELRGTPTMAGIYEFELEATDECSDYQGGPQTDVESYVFTVRGDCEPLSAPTKRTVAGTVNVLVEPLALTQGGFPPVKARRVAGEPFPPGLKLEDGLSDGTPPVLSGIPTDPGTYTFTAKFEDSCNPPQQAQTIITVWIQGAPGP